MIPTKPNPSAAQASKTALVIGQGDGRLVRRLAKEFGRVVTARWQSEPRVDLPGDVWTIDGPTAAQEMVSTHFARHEEMLALCDIAVFDEHPCDVKPSVRAAFANDLFTCLERKPIEFGDDILDGFQGIYHTAQNAAKLLRCPSPRDFTRGTFPAISIAAGPSLARHLPALRALQNKALLISVDSALDGLLAEGITPHLVTPMERIPEVMKAFSRKSYPGVTFAGLPVVRKEVVDLFDKHWFVPSTDIHMAWAGAGSDLQHAYGQSTGTMCMALACIMTSGPVYLVGHDLAYDGATSHWDGTPQFHRLKGENTVEVKGHHGPLRADFYWDMYRRQIEGHATLHGNVINVNHYDAIGAIIHGCKSEPLPDASTLPAFTLPVGVEHPEREERLRELLRRLPADVDAMLARIGTGASIAERTWLSGLCPSENWMMWAYCLRSLLAQTSYDCVQGSPADAMQSFDDALRNVLTELRPMINAMSVML